ncbi:hypothetical protein [Paenirhodobacter hankyongi]|uniref:Pilus assembly protein n=1 Tax=Paenirhodobacter hankyongi TaxID=2294033 RepID=A0A421BJG1_9RHOB|nr:hypothetical protein [Sinirhodobacter hankyongi]RLL61947.1 hypothetical protein DYS74_17630 [Sinirhodobacter hankyongi]
MKFFKFARKIRTEEDGAVTVDWVVLTAAVVGLGAAALLTISSNTKTAAGKIGTYLGSVTVNTATN